LIEEIPMSDATRRTIRTIAQGAVTVLLWLALYLPSLLTDLGITRDSWEGIGILLAILAGVTRLSQSGKVEPILDAVGLGKGPKGKHKA
jgi:hypothetical protein